MHRYVTISMFALASSFATTASARPTPACKPLFDAMEKLAVTDHMTTQQRDGKTGEAITAGGKSYVKYGDKWVVTPMTTQAALELARENVRAAKVCSCKQLPDSPVDGVAASTISAFRQVDEGSSDGTFWISKSIGLPLRPEIDYGSDGKKIHSSIHYSYSNIRPPIN
jgi:hypothetical protein